MTHGLLHGGRSELAALFTELDGELLAADLSLEILLVGGSWLLWHRASRATRDVDSAFRIPRSAEAAIAQVGDRHDLSQDWLNDHATAFLPHDFAIEECTTAFRGERLSVLAPKAETIFLMKLHRAHPVDLADMRMLWPLCSFGSPAEAAERYASAYPLAPDDPFLADLIDRISSRPT